LEESNSMGKIETPKSSHGENSLPAIIDSRVLEHLAQLCLGSPTDAQSSGRFKAAMFAELSCPYYLHVEGISAMAKSEASDH
jgi:hypothetical protein